MSTPDPVQEGLRLLSLAGAKGLPLRLIGGAAIRLLCPSRSSRPVRDLDLLTTTEAEAAVASLLEGEGYVPDREPAVPGVQLFFPRFRGRHVELYIDRIPFGPGLDLRPALRAPGPAIPPTLLLTSKLLISPPRERDLADMVALVLDHPEVVSALQTVIDHQPPLVGRLRHGLTQLARLTPPLPAHVVAKIETQITQLIQEGKQFS